MKQRIKSSAEGFTALDQAELYGTYGGNIFTSILESGISRAVSLIGFADALYEFGKGFVDGAK